MITRKRVPELMDDPALDYDSHARALRGLARLNAMSSSADSLWVEIEKVARASSATLRVLDIATGGGDIPIALAAKAQQAGLHIEFVGSDISIDAIKYARARAEAQNVNVKFVSLNIFEDAFPNDCDILMTSLFTHHLDPPDVIHLLGKMKDAALVQVLVSDLVRSEIAYSLVWLATRVLSSSPIVHYDGPVSVNASYTNSELRDMALQAGLVGVKVKNCPPCRQLLVWNRNE